MVSPRPESTPAEPVAAADQPPIGRGASGTAEPRPASNAGWAVVSLVFFWPLAFAAFNHAFEVYPLWATGDVEGARSASRRVRWLGQLSLWIAGGLLLLAVILYTILVIVLITHGGDGDHEGGGRMSG